MGIFSFDDDAYYIENHDLMLCVSPKHLAIPQVQNVIRKFKDHKKCVATSQHSIVFTGRCGKIKYFIDFCIEKNIMVSFSNIFDHRYWVLLSYTGEIPDGLKKVRIDELLK